MPDTQALFFKDFENAHIPEIMEEIYLQSIYAPYLIGKRDLIVVDVGQNIGLFSYYVHDHAKRVIGLEPSTMHQDTLKQMIKFNKLTNVETLPYGLSNENGEKTFYLTKNTTAFSLMQLDPNVQTETIQVIDVDKLFELAKIDHIDLLKLDPEGEESKIITSDAFKRHTKDIPLVIGEWHNWSAMSQIQFKQAFEKLGYTFHWIGGTRAACYVAQQV